ncbi:MAG: thioredoxin family protein, partial [Fluviicola sp.]
MKRTIGFLFLVALSTMAFVLPAEELKTLNIGDAAPLADRKMTAVDGKEYSLNDLKQENGLVVVFSCNT